MDLLYPPVILPVILPVFVRQVDKMRLRWPEAVWAQSSLMTHLAGDSETLIGPFTKSMTPSGHHEARSDDQMAFVRFKQPLRW